MSGQWEGGAGETLLGRRCSMHPAASQGVRVLRPSLTGPPGCLLPMLECTSAARRSGRGDVSGQEVMESGRGDSRMTSG
eukprot:109614-Chlamydomonas_euryale.AAC.1